LPETPNTLWLRLLGKGNVQRRAIEEINRLGEDNPYRTNVLELLSDLKVVLETKKNRDKEDRELLMSLRTSPLYLEHLEAVRQKARNEGLEQGLERGRGEKMREITLKLLSRKLGNLSTELMAKIDSLSIERLDALSEALLDFQVVDDLIVWLDKNY
jgi:predicted transposase YdaD